MPVLDVRQCWKRFKADFPDTHEQILSTFEELNRSDTPEQTIGQREKNFRKTCERIETIARQAAGRSRFEFAILASGSNINQDGGLAYLLETEGAKGVSMLPFSTSFSSHPSHPVFLIQMPLQGR
jgi:hypothetical protein